MLKLANITFPLYKLRAYLTIDKNPLGKVKITTIKGTYVLDDYSINKTFAERRKDMLERYPKKDIYKLKEQVNYLRQLVKYKSGTTFIDSNGNIFKYHKSSKLYNITSNRITRIEGHGRLSVIEVENIEFPFLIGFTISPETTHASIMHTKDGPFLYDLTNKPHEPYKRKI